MSQEPNSQSKSTACHSAIHIPENIYTQIAPLRPVACVDLVVEDERERILLIKHANEPVKGQWWFPGGRVLLLETLEQGAMRKLKDECGLESFQMKEMGTDDSKIDIPDDANLRYAAFQLCSILHKKNMQRD